MLGGSSSVCGAVGPWGCGKEFFEQKNASSSKWKLVVTSTQNCPKTFFARQRDPSPAFEFNPGIEFFLNDVTNFFEIETRFSSVSGFRIRVLEF